jgi:LuxR family maltose regulon positive regulatory protein
MDTKSTEFGTNGSQSLDGSSLTTAEQRLVPLLSTDLSFRELGDRLRLSPRMTKFQASSIYRKLGVSSRSEAVDRLRLLGLLK